MSSGDVQYGLTKKDRDQLLAIHNAARKQVGVEPLVWDETLAKHAEDYSKKCIWAHWSQNKADIPQPCFKNVDGPAVYVTSVSSGECPDGSAPPGENLGMGIPTIESRCYPKCKRSDKGGCGEDKPGEFCPCGASKGACVSTNWYNEIWDHNCGSKINVNDCRSAQCGHYTQMVSQLSKRIGCAANRCESLRGLNLSNPNVAKESAMDYFVCEMTPHGNLVGAMPFENSNKYCDGAQHRNMSLSPSVFGDAAASAPSAAAPAAGGKTEPVSQQEPPQKNNKKGDEDKKNDKKNAASSIEVPKVKVSGLYPANRNAELKARGLPTGNDYAPP